MISRSDKVSGKLDEDLVDFVIDVTLEYIENTDEAVFDAALKTLVS